MISKTSDTKSPDTLVTIGSDNIFADLGLPNPGEMLVKAELSKQIYLRLQDQKFTIETAVNRLGLEANQVTAMFDGKSSELSIEQLFRALNALDCDIEIIIKNKANNQSASQTKVIV